MSSSKGIGTSALEISKTLPKEILNYLLIKTSYKKAIIFDPNNNDSILDLFDDYDKAAEIYYKERVKNPVGRAWELSQVNKIAKELIFLPRFRDIVNYVQSPSVDIYKKFEEIKGKKLTDLDKKELDKRIKYAKIWLEQYASEDKKVGIMADKVKVKLSEEQKKYLKLIIKLLGKDWKAEKLQQELYQIAKDNKMNVKNAFQAIYLSLTGKKYGPKAGWFLLNQEKEKIIKRFKEVVK
jgi:lysyl-tRNA synthetase class 1